MKNKIKLAMLSGGVLAAIASFVPLTSYAEDVSISAVVNTSITIDANATSGVSVSGNAGDTMENGVITTKVTSNTKYTISLKTKTTQTAMVGANTGAEIPAGTNIAANNSAWGVKKKTGAADANNESTYTALTSTNQTFFTSVSKSADAGDTIKFPVGISTSANQTADTYSVDITITAAAATV